MGVGFVVTCVLGSGKSTGFATTTSLAISLIGAVAYVTLCPNYKTMLVPRLEH